MQIWFKFDAPDDEEPAYTANVFTEDDGARIEWWNEDVGYVYTVNASSIQNAERWLTDRDFIDYTG